MYTSCSQSSKCERKIKHLNDCNIATCSLLQWGREPLVPPRGFWSKTVEKISITKEICKTVGFAPWRKSYEKANWRALVNLAIPLKIVKIVFSSRFVECPEKKWQESGSVWTQWVQFGLLSLFPSSVNHSHYFLLEISKNNWWSLILKVLTNQNLESKLG